MSAAAARAAVRDDHGLSDADVRRGGRALGVDLVLPPTAAIVSTIPWRDRAVPCGSTTRRRPSRGRARRARRSRVSTACWPSATVRSCSRRWSPKRAGLPWHAVGRRQRQPRQAPVPRALSAPPACRPRGTTPCRRGTRSRRSAGVTYPVRREAARALGQPRRDPRRRCLRACSRRSRASARSSGVARRAGAARSRRPSRCRSKATSTATSSRSKA